MKETIYTIPINEAFEKRCGCPLCTLRRKLEHDSLDYILGAAMMEPDVRTETNKSGFCAQHYGIMIGMKRKLSLALTLESRLAKVGEYLDESISKPAARPLKGAGSALSETAQSCFVCSRINLFEDHYYKNIFYMWKTMPQFRLLYMEQPYFCLRHASKLIELAPENLGKKEAPELVRLTAQMTKNYLSQLKDDVSAFCKSFDYRSAGAVLNDDQKAAAERAIEFLSGFSENVPVDKE